MVKNSFGCKPRPKHARILKKLRQRRRMADIQQQLREDEITEIVDTFSCEIVTVPPELQSSRHCLASSKEATNVSSLEKVSDAVVCDRQIVPYTDLTSIPGVNIFYPEVAADSNAGLIAKQIAITESSVHQPIDFTSTDAEDERPQHPDEKTDEYLAHLFAPSLVNVTTDELTFDTGSEDYSRLRNLLSSDTQHTPQLGASAEVATISLGNLFKTASCDTSLGLNTLFHEKTASREQVIPKPGLSAVLSDVSLHLNTLFNNKTTSCETTSMGLRTLFEEKEDLQHQLKSCGSTSDITSLSTPAIYYGTDATSTTTVSSPSSRITCNYCKNVGSLPGVASSSSLLGNLFASLTDVRNDAGEVLTATERKKAINAEDLAEYLKSDDDRTHPKSTSLSTLVHQLEAFFANYRAVLHELENIKREKN